MYLSIATTRPDAVDLGFVLYKHPDRVFRSDDARSKNLKVVGFYPEATAERCEFVMLVSVDPVERVRGLAWNGGIAQYVEPLPFLASSYMSQAISISLRSAMNGIATAKDPEHEARLQSLCADKWPLEIKVSPVRTSPHLITTMFEPLGWSVEIQSQPLDVPGSDRDNALHTIILKGDLRIQDALSQLYVLLPALDPFRHYFYDESEVAKLIDKSRNWLEDHPSRELIIGRYLSKSRELRETAISQFAEVPEVVTDEYVDERVPAHELRHQKIVELIGGMGDVSIADLGCGEGKLLSRIAALPGNLRIVGVEPSLRDLEKARKALSRNPARQMDPRVKLRHGSIVYADDALKGFDVAVLSEVIEHIDLERLGHAERCVFGFMQPATVIVTTPNSGFNIVFDMEEGKFRHKDHRFEWSVAEAEDWCRRIGSTYGYTYELDGAGGYEEYLDQHLSHFIIFRKVSTQ
ncbi:3' terminal RNA ribose 2'-O-methyltransferase Hen1 [Agrobacterium rubi]|nr:3' terminal RNA ribose 2'-O-methyltransferase Hen1 [Agrobacterium rubi]NTF24810.1 3' terminal RNA ribose 2'-O-methyltransferase Hen1 [Agrobacterium rubi]